jgi:hypothetical protein
MPRSDSQKERPSLFGVNGNICHAGDCCRVDFMPGVEHTGNSVLTALVTLCSQRHLALNGERAARKIHVGKLYR